MGDAMQFCCAQFEGLAGSAGERSFAVFATQLFAVFATQLNDGAAAFILQHRSTEMNSVPPETTSPLSLVSEIHIFACPWCGVKLHNFYRSSYRKLLRPDLKLPPL
jgi:hypothetical protein